MQRSLHQIEGLFKSLTTIILTACALGLLLIPSRLGMVTENLSSLTTLFLGIGLYPIGLLNQSTIFIKFQQRTQRIVTAMVTLGLGALALVFFQADLVLEGTTLMVLFSGQLYLLFLTTGKYEFKNHFFLLAYGLLLAINGVLLIAKQNVSLGYSSKEVFVLGGLFILSSALSLSILYFFQNRAKLSQVLLKLTAIPWVAWVVFALLSHQFNSILVTGGFVILPLIARIDSWEKLLLPEDDSVGHEIVKIASIAEFLMLIALIGIGYNAQELTSLSGMLPKNSSTLMPQNLSLVVMLLTKGFTLYGLAAVVFTVRLLKERLITEGKTENSEESAYKGWYQWLARSLKSVASPSYSLHTKLEIQEEQIAALSHQLENEKKRSAQLRLLAELSHQLESQLDQPVAAQLAVNTLQRALNCKHVAIFENDVERREFVPMASAGTFIPTGYRQSTSKGLLGRTLRLRKTQIANDAGRDPDIIKLESAPIKSAFAIPLIYYGHVKAILEVGNDRPNAFNSQDVHLAEMVTAELIRAWERSGYHYRLTKLIKAGITLSPLLEPQTTITEIAMIAREILQARFVFVMLLDQDSNLSHSSHSGNAPRLLNSLTLNPVKDKTIQAALNAHEVFRIRDVRKYRKASRIEIDHNGLRSLLAIPIRLHHLSIGTILAFGKQREIFFSENDESLASLLSSQAAAAIESTWLYQELHNTLKNTSQLYSLSVNILQSEGLQQAAQHITEATAKISNATVTGILLFNKDQEIEADIIIDEGGIQPGKQHPLALVQQTLESGQMNHVTQDQVSATICFPLQTHRRRYGALWFNVPKIQEYFAHHASNMQTLANQAILALERSILLNESQQQAQEIEAAYEELELAYDRTLTALMSALDARDRETEGHSIRVSELTCLLGAEMGLDITGLKALERGSLLHDIGKIGISDTILHKPDKLNEQEWKVMRTHPDIGARIVENIPFLQETLPVIRYHQERWDGSGYPVGLSGKDIPLQARIFAVTDVFDALTSNRPYREQISTSEALDYLREQAGELFDPDVVSAFEIMWRRNEMEDNIP